MADKVVSIPLKTDEGLGYQASTPLTDKPIDEKSKGRSFFSKKKEQNNGRSSFISMFITTYANMTGEFLGTLILTLTICSSVSSAILTGAPVGIWQVTVLMWIGVSLAIYTTSHICDAHLNPAITIAFAILRPRSFSWKKIFPYVVAQLLGGIVAGAILYFFAYHQIFLYEEKNQIVRGTNRSVITASMFGEYYPNPALFDYNSPEGSRAVPTFQAFVVEFWGAAILAFVIFSLTHDSNLTPGPKDNKVIVPFLIGGTLSYLISLYGPYTQAGLNPARDFGPRLVAVCAGWGRVAIPGPRSGFWIYILAPILGAVSGAALNDLVVSRLARLIKKRKNENGYSGGNDPESYYVKMTED